MRRWFQQKKEDDVACLGTVRVSCREYAAPGSAWSWLLGPVSGHLSPALYHLYRLTLLLFLRCLFDVPRGRMLSSGWALARLHSGLHLLACDSDRFLMGHLWPQLWLLGSCLAPAAPALAASVWLLQLWLLRSGCSSSGSWAPAPAWLLNQL